MGTKSSGKRSRSPRENDVDKDDDENAPLSQQWTAPPDLERTLAYALPHAVVPQLLRPSVLAPFLWPYCIKLRTRRDAMVAVTELSLKCWSSGGREASDWQFPWTLPNVTSIKFTGTVDLAHVFVGAPTTAPTLRRLDFSKTGLFHADFARHMPRFEKIEELNLEKCLSFVPRSGLQYVSKLRTLRVLNLCDCQHVDAESLGQVAELRLLEVLDLTKCRGVNSESLKRISTLPALHTLLMRGCKGVDADGFGHVAKIPHLTELNVGGSPIDDAALAQIGKCSKLRCLHFQACRFRSEPQVHFISSLSELEVLDFSETDVGTAELGQLRPLTRLKELVLNSCAPEKDLPCVGSALEKLDLTMCTPDGALLTFVAKLPKLKTLLLVGNDFPPLEAHHLPLSSTLTRLDVSYCEEPVPGAMLEEVARSTNLRHLNLSNATLSDPVDFGVLSPLRSLQHLDLSETDVDAGTFRAVNHPLLEVFAISMFDGFAPGRSLSPLLAELGTMRCLHHLRLTGQDDHDHSVSVDDVSAIATFPRLRTLEFTSLRFESDSFKRAEEFRVLHTLSFHKCGSSDLRLSLPLPVLVRTECIPNVIVEK